MAQQFFLHTLHPEVLQTVPRPGGIANIELPKKKRRKLEGDKSAEDKGQRSSASTKGGQPRKSLLTVQTFAVDAKNKIILEIPKRVKLREAITANPWVVELDDGDVDNSANILPEVFQDAVDLLLCTISTVMLLSKENKMIPQNFLQCTFSYLKCITDDYGNNPPNIQSIINHILMLSGNNMKSLLSEENESPPVESKIRSSETAPDSVPANEVSVEE